MAKKPVHLVDSEDPDREAIAPIEVGDPSCAADLSIDQAHMEAFMGDEAPAEVSCARPPKGTFFTVFREAPGAKWINRDFYFMMEIPHRDPFLVAPAIAKRKKDEGEDTIRPVLIVRYVTMAGDEGLWALKLDPPDGKANPWNRTAKKALAVADEAKDDRGWVRLYSNTKAGHYTHTVSPLTLTEEEPCFSSRTFKELVNSVFPPEQVVLDGSHQIWIDLSRGSKK